MFGSQRIDPPVLAVGIDENPNRMSTNIPSTVCKNEPILAAPAVDGQCIVFEIRLDVYFRLRSELSSEYEHAKLRLNFRVVSKQVCDAVVFATREIEIETMTVDCGEYLMLWSQHRRQQTRDWIGKSKTWAGLTCILRSPNLPEVLS